MKELRARVVDSHIQIQMTYFIINSALTLQWKENPLLWVSKIRLMICRRRPLLLKSKLKSLKSNWLRRRHSQRKADNRKKKGYKPWKKILSRGYLTLQIIPEIKILKAGLLTVNIKRKKSMWTKKPNSFIKTRLTHQTLNLQTRNTSQITHPKFKCTLRKMINSSWNKLLNYKITLSTYLYGYQKRIEWLLMKETGELWLQMIQVRCGLSLKMIPNSKEMIG